MDWSFAVKRNREALQRVVAGLVAMAGLAGLAFSPFTGSKRRAAIDAEASIAVAQGWPEGPDEGQLHAHPTLPRHLHRAVLRLLRPAEAAARRLVMMAAHGLVVTLPPPRARKPEPPAPGRGRVTGIWMPPHLQWQAARLLSVRRRTPRRLALPLFDPLRAGEMRRGPRGRPRIFIPGASAPPLLRGARPAERKPKGLPDDPISAARLALRLGALAAALDDLPRQARRFARWQAARDAAGAQTRNRDAAGAQAKGNDAEGAQNENHDAAGAQAGNSDAAAAQGGNRGAMAAGVGPRGRKRFRRVWPLKPGRPPGLDRKSGHPVHEVLRDVHSLALQALDKPDTS